jgi:hypothetical protein
MPSISLVLRSRAKVGVSRMATGETVLAAILRDAVLRTAPQDEGFQFLHTLKGGR